jgi:hypothetical protein
MDFDITNNKNSINFTNITKTSSMANSQTIEQITPLENRLPIMATFISLYALIFFFGITGNALVVCMYLIFNLKKKNKLFLFFF